MLRVAQGGMGALQHRGGAVPRRPAVFARGLWRPLARSGAKPGRSSAEGRSQRDDGEAVGRRPIK